MKIQLANADRAFNGEDVVRKVVEILKIKVSFSTIRNSLALHPEYPSLLAMSDSFSEWNVENMAVKLTRDELVQIPLPAIVHLADKREKYFVVLTKVTQSHIQYTDPSVGHHEESVQEFCSKWTGNALLISTNERSGEESYNQTQKQEIFTRVSTYTAWGLLAIVLLSPILFFTIPLALIYIVKVIGGAFSFVLLQKQLGLRNTSFDAFCKMGSKSDCDAVIHDPRTKIFGIVHLSEISTGYFAGSLLSMLIGAFATTSVELPLFMLSVMTLPVSAVAIYYQGWKIQKWCPLCLMVTAVLWVEFIFHLLFSVPDAHALNTWLIPTVSFALPLLFWIVMRQPIIDSVKHRKIEKTLHRFLKSDKVFQKLLEDQTLVNVGTFTHEITEGPDDAPLTIVVVSNPVCGPCAIAHAHMEGILKQFKGKLKVVFRFAIDISNTDSSAYEMLTHLLTINMSHPPSAIKALHAWYFKNGQNDMLRWKKEHPDIGHPNHRELSLALKDHAIWCSNVGITATPTIFINGQKLPQEFSIGDLKYQIRKLLEKEVNELVEVS